MEDKKVVSVSKEEIIKNQTLLLANILEELQGIRKYLESMPIVTVKAATNSSHLNKTPL